VQRRYPPGAPPRPAAAQPGPARRAAYRPGTAAERRRRRQQRRPLHIPWRGCLLALIPLLLALLAGAAYLLWPTPATLLIFGIDYTDPSTYAARSDSILLMRFTPLPAQVRLLSIPRDLWVSIPGQGENRINTAHFLAESQRPGSGPAALRATIEQNFGVRTNYYLRFRFESFRDIIDALGGVDIVLSEPAAGYPAGRVHLTGRKALAFVRDRSSATSDFGRMSHGQLMFKTILRNLMNPLKWLRLPAATRIFFQAVNTDVPLWQWPRLAFTLLRLGPGGVESNIIDSNMVTPTTTDLGAMVLAPNWTLIRPLVSKLFPR
jgi:polyisoprenyl-teichoic acid--peptidoglycan teichoic acid transferase